jgi:hypothetical protein
VLKETKAVERLRVAYNVKNFHSYLSREEYGFKVILNRLL